MTPALFARFPTLEALAQADVAEVEEYIHSTGFFRAKARDIVAASQMLLEEYGGKVPDTMEELLKLPGVGRKTANLILGDVYHTPGVVVADTHCIRITGRLGLTDGTKDPGKVEKAAARLPAPGGVQRLLPPAGAPRPGGVHCPQARVPKLHPAPLVRFFYQAIMPRRPVQGLPAGGILPQGPDIAALQRPSSTYQPLRTKIAPACQYKYPPKTFPHNTKNSSQPNPHKQL